MRTTLTLEPDVASRLSRLREKQSVSLKEVVNKVLRAGLDHLDEAPSPSRSYEIRPLPLGKLQVASLDDVSELLALAEGEAFK